MSIIDIQEVSYLNQNTKPLHGIAIDTPKTNSQLDIYFLEIRGWVVGKTSQAKEVWLTYFNTPQKPLKKTRVSIPRHDVAQHYSEVSHAEKSGFSLLISVIGMPLEMNLGLQVILEDGTHLNAIKIKLRHQAVSSSHQPKLQPLIVNALGRTGSTWLMHLLAACPNIIVQRQYPYEAYAAKYWLYTLFKFVSTPMNYINTQVPDEFFQLTTQWLNNQIHHNTQVQKWFGRDYIEQAMAFCQQSIEAFYVQIANTQNQAIDLSNPQSPPIYFAEKFGPGHPVQFIYELYPQVSEIFLVRDFRDVLCSSVSFAKKSGVNFGQYQNQNNEEAIKLTKANAKGFLQAWQRRSVKAHLVRYEDLILNPVQTLQAILEYLNLEHDVSTVEQILENASNNLPAMMQGKHQTTSDPKKSVGRWQHDLDDSLKTLCQESLTEELKAFGYETE